MYSSYAVSDIQNYFECILTKHNENINNLSIRLYVNTAENKITFKIKLGYYFELLTPETIELLGSTTNKITKEKMVKMCHILKWKEKKKEKKKTTNYW